MSSQNGQVFHEWFIIVPPPQKYCKLSYTHLTSLKQIKKVYKLFSHRYLLVVVIIATSQMILQLWLEGRSLVVHVCLFRLKRQGVDLLNKILQTRNQPSPISKTSRPEVTLATQPLSGWTRMMPFPSRFGRWSGAMGRRIVSIHSNTHVSNKNKNNEPPPSLANKTAAAVTSPRLSPSSQSPSPLPGATSPPNSTPQPPKSSLQTPPEAEPTGRGIKKAKPEEEHKNKRKHLRKSSQRPLKDSEKDPQALHILQKVQLQDGDASTIQTEDVAAPGAAIFVLDGNLINLSAKCATALQLPMEKICRDDRTDIARMVFQVWLWGLTIWGLLLESVPHLAAVAVSHFIGLSFVALALRRNLILNDKFISVVNNECDGVDVLPNFWGLLIKLTIVSVVFVTATALALTFLGFKLYSVLLNSMQVLDWRNFKKLGASRMVRIAHTLSSIFAAILQLNAYFVTVFLVSGRKGLNFGCSCEFTIIGLWDRRYGLTRWSTKNGAWDQRLFITQLPLKPPWGFCWHFQSRGLILTSLSFEKNDKIVLSYSLKNEKLIGIVTFLIFDVALLLVLFKKINLLKQCLPFTSYVRISTRTWQEPGCFVRSLFLHNLISQSENIFIVVNFTGIIACILMFASLLIAAACLIVLDRGLLSKVNRDSKAPSNTSKPEMDIHEVAFPQDDFTEFTNQGNLEELSISQRGSGSIISPPQAIHKPSNHQDGLESSLSC
ncbi:hypothetical protein VP01_1877g13 [Puccinia sorghi]|uniref:Uncharacterized protein n=1 Tax=Puccinia sorghi TaxID=27349 RepID=A0A0L6VD41_9BASI|nr:hypothetical protein VP01_1877g13 [Puccinia sorghi]